MHIRTIKFSGWGTKYTLLVTLVILILSTWLFGSTVAAPSGRHPNHHSKKHSYKIIPVLKPTDYNLKGTNANSSVNQLTNSIRLAPAHLGLADSTEPQLRKLAEYEQAAGGALAGGMMVFTNTPTSTAEAQSNASDMSSLLKNFAKYDLKPVVIMEPTTSSGGVVNFSSYKNGAYDSALNSYFGYLKSNGITDTNMGMSVYFPEANLPEWGPVDVADFGPNVTRTVNIQKKYFPGSQSSIMLDAESYPAGSTDWSNGSYVSLLPFISGIPAGLLDSFGLQGFPWAPPANQGGDTSYNPAVYLNGSLAAEAASHLGTSNIWLNTGTFSAMYTKNKAQTVTMGAAQRQSILNSVLAQAMNLRNSGYSVAVNLFSEDKSSTSEAINWSYQTAEDKTVLNNFALQLHSNNIELWLFTG